MLELLVVIAVLGVLLALSPMLIRSPAVRLYSNDLKGQINQARYESIKRNRPVAVVWNSGAQALETRLDATDPSIGAACNSTTITNRSETARYRDIIVQVSSQPIAIAFLPSGQARWCNGSVFSELDTELVVSDGKNMQRVSVSPTGKVRIL